MLTDDSKSTKRLAALRGSGLLDSPAEPAFDRLTQLATAALRVPIALISLVDHDRQFFKSQCGLPAPHAEARETPLQYSLCQHVVMSQTPLIVSDARQDELLKDNLGVCDLGVVAYAGVPVRDEAGFILGSMCAVDVKPREWSSEDIALLEALSAQVTLEIKLRTQNTELTQDRERQQRATAEQQTVTRLTIHDLRTPVSAMIMGMEVIQNLGPLTDAQRTYLALCKRNGNALLSMIDNVLDISSVDLRGSAALQRALVHPRDLAVQALEQVLPLVSEKKLMLDSNVSETLPMIFADSDKLVRLLVNLLANAIKFTPAGGHVWLTARVDHEGGGEMLEFAVRDTGSGIAEPEHIFEDGVRLDRHAVTRRSTGLGLTFCKRIIDAHGGRIWFETVVAVGSTFHVTVPINA